MPHTHPVADNDLHFVINPITREIANESKKIKLMQGDHASEIFTFEIPRYIDGHDMSLCNKIAVHYINIGSSGSNADVYIVTDTAISDKEDKIVFSWTIYRTATKYAGNLNFLIKFSCIDDDATIVYQWNTDIFKGIMISTGMDNEETIVEDNIDLLEQWKNEIIENQTSNQSVKKIESLNFDNMVNLRDIDSGTYILYGKFKPYLGSDSTLTFGSNLLVNILKGTDYSQVQIFYPNNNCVQYLKITDTSYERKDVYFNDLASISASDIDELNAMIQNSSTDDNDVFHAVLFNVSQTLTEDQKAQARANISAVGPDEFNQVKDDLVQLDNAVESGLYQFNLVWNLGFPIDGNKKTGGDGTNGITTDACRLYRDATVNYNTERIRQIRAFAVDSEYNLGTFVVYTNGSIIQKTDNFYRLMAIPQNGIELTVDDSLEISIVSDYYAFGVKENKENIEKIKNGDINNNSISKEKLDFEVGDTVLSKLKEPKINILEYVTFAQGAPLGLDGYIQYDDRVSTDAIAVELGKHYYIEYNSQIYQLRAFMFDPDGTEHSFVAVGKSSYISFDYKIIRFCLILKDSTGTLDIETAKNDLKIYDYYAIKKPSKWEGKKAVVLGDSITEGIVVNDDKSQEQVAMQWWRFVADDCMLDKITAYGLSGSSIGNGVDSTKSFLNRYQHMDDDADLVIVFGGTNDYGNITASSTATFGELSDTNDGTFCGAIRILCEGLIKKYIGKRIVFIAPIHRGGDFTENVLGKTLKDYVDAIKIICSDYGIKVIDALSNSGFAPSVPEFASAYMDALLLHPNPIGHKMLGEYISAELESV